MEMWKHFKQWDSAVEAGRLKVIPTPSSTLLHSHLQSRQLERKAPLTEEHVHHWACPEAKGDWGGPGSFPRELCTWEGACLELRSTVVSALGLRMGYITAPPPGPQIQPGPSSASTSPAICLCCFPLIEEAAALPKARPAPCGKFPTFLPHRKINNGEKKCWRNDNDGPSTLQSQLASPPCRAEPVLGWGGYGDTAASPRGVLTARPCNRRAARSPSPLPQACQPSFVLRVTRIC